MIYLSLLKRFWPIIPVMILLGYMSILKLENSHYRSEVEKLKLENSQMSMTLEQLKVLSDNQAKEFKEAQVKADKWHAYSIEQEEAIKSEEIPEDCQGAMSYLVEKAQELK